MSSATSEEAWRPEPILMEYARLAPAGPVLDLGIGDGRNALALAAEGREVIGWDMSEEAIGRCQTRATEVGLPVVAQVGDVRQMDLPDEHYALVIVAWVLNFMTLAESGELCAKVRRCLLPEGAVYISAFSPTDAAYTHNLERYEMTEPNTFYMPKADRSFHFFGM